MNTVINDMLVVPVHPDRKKSSDIACCLYDINTGKYLLVNATDEKSKKMKEEIGSAKATLLFVHSRFDAYGIVRDSKNSDKPILYWIRGNELKLIKDDIINYTERYNIIDISDKDTSIFRGQYDKKRFSITRIVDHNMRTPISADSFIESLTKVSKPAPVIQGGQSNIVINTVKDDCNNTENVTSEAMTSKDEAMTSKSDSQGEIETQTTTTNSEVMNDDSKEQLDEKESNDNNAESAVSEKLEQTEVNCKATETKDELEKALIEATIAMNNTTRELKKVADSYKDAMVKSFGNFDIDVETKFVGVSDIKSDSNVSIKEDDSTGEIGTEEIYDFILKVMKVNDTISVPRTYYEKLTTIIKRNMMLSMDGNKYDSIILIRFNRACKENIVARVEYDATSDYTRITIIKQYSLLEVTDKQLLDYEIKYNQWKRLHSYRTSD